MIFIGIFFAILSIIYAQPDEATNTFGKDSENTAVLDYDKIRFDSEVPNKPHFIKFYAPWCGHCQRLEPVWEELAIQFNIQEREEDVAVARVDCTKHTELCSEHNIQGYPTLRFYKNGDSEKYQGGRDIESLSSHIINSLSDVKNKDGLFSLTEENFDQHISSGDHFIKFFAPWCGHCQTLAPIWKSLAQRVSKEPEFNKLKIAHVDCTSSRQVCKDQNIEGYPTLIYFRNGAIVEKYSGSRTEEKFIHFIERMMGEQAIADNSQNHKKELQEVQIDDAAAEVMRDGNVLVGTDDNFGNVIANHFTFVKFYAPWCGHCKGMAQDWSLLADHYASNYEVKIAEVDCTAESLICQKYEIDGYPTLILFEAGNKKLEYENERELSFFKDFIQDEVPMNEQNHDEL